MSDKPLSSEEIVNGRKLVFESEWDHGIGGSVWPIAHTICSHLQDERFYPAGWWQTRKVIELGAGTGIVGMAAALLGAEVCLTDIGRHVDLLNKNVDRNLQDLRSRIQVVEYKWGEPVDQLPGPFDVILGSDITYDSDFFDVFIDSLDKLCRPETLVILGLQQRERSDCCTLFEKLSTRFRFDKVSTKDDRSHPLLGVFRMRRRMDDVIVGQVQQTPLQLSKLARDAFAKASK